VLFKNVAAMRSGDWKEKNAYTYGLHGTPTTFTLEARLAEIEGGSTACWRRAAGGDCMVDFALLKSGDDVLLPDNVYNPNRELGRWLSADYGITARYYDPLIGEGIAADPAEHQIDLDRGAGLGVDGSAGPAGHLQGGARARRAGGAG
jgi:cystathionine beta-lyase